MAAIRIGGPESIQGVSADPAPVPRYPIADAADFGGASAAADQNLGAAISAIGDHLAERRRVATDQVAHDTASLDYATNLQKATLDLQNQYPAGGQGFTDALKQKSEELKQHTLDGLTDKGLSLSPVGQDALNSHFTQVQQQYLIHGVTFENNAQVANLKNTLGKNADAIGADVYSSGDVDAGVKRLDQTVGAGRGLMPAPELDDFTKNYRKQIVTKGIDGYLARGDAASQAGDTDGAKKFYDQADVLRRKYLGDESNPAQQSRAGVQSSILPADIAPRVQQQATAAGLDPKLVSRIVQIESGGNPNAATGSYRGLMQLSQAEFQKYGGGDIYNPDDNLRAGVAALKDHIAQFNAQFGRDPTATELYLAHQQGDAGLAAHESHPDAPAWQNMLSTGEGRQKGAGWAKAAIWGNLPASAKSQFGSVENVTSADFMHVWQQRVEGGGSVRTAQAGGPQAAAVASTTGQATDQNGVQVAQADTGTATDAGPQIASNDSGSASGAQANGALTPDAELSFQIKHRIEAARNASTVDQERKLRLQQQQAKKVSDAAEDETFAKIVNKDPSISATSIVGDTRLLTERKQHLVSLLNAAQKDKDTSTYGAGFYDLFKQIHADPADPKKITDPSQLYEHVGADGDLTMAGLEKLRGELAGKKTPDGEAESEMKKQLFKTAQSQLSAKNELLHIKDPKGEEILLKWMGQFYSDYDKAKQAGKTPSQLLTPGSPDYVGRSIDALKRSPAQINADILSANMGTDATSAGKDVDTTTPRGLIAAVQLGKISRADGEALALKNGWIRAAAPPAPVVPAPADPVVPMSR